MLGTGTQVIVFEPKWERPLQEMPRKNRKWVLTADGAVCESCSSGAQDSQLNQMAFIKV